MKRRTFLKQANAAGACAFLSESTTLADLSPTDLRPASPIGQAKPSRELPKESVAHCRVSDPSAVKILQCTDLHFHCARERYGQKADAKTREDLARMVEHHSPDLIAFTGDVWHDPSAGKALEIFNEALEAMTTLDTPWLFTWGNHDLLDDYGPAQVALTEAKKSLYRGGHSGGNYRVLLDDATGKPLFDLICLNTTTQGVQAPQEQWLRSLSKIDNRPKGALCFLHIPLQQYIDVAKQAKGIKHEAVCTYGEDGSAFPLLKQLGVRACFCGHDHVNDYTGTHDGIAMVYGRATGHAGYGGDKVRKGAKLITLDTNTGMHSWKSVFADGESWVPNQKSR